MRIVLRYTALILAFSLITAAAWGTGTTTQISVDPYTGSIHFESGEPLVPLYEGTFQLETKYIIGGLLSDATNIVGQLVTNEEIPALESSVFQFWQNACCYANAWTCPSYRESLKFGVSVKDTRNTYEVAKKYTLFHLSHRALWEIGYSDADSVLRSQSSLCDSDRAVEDSNGYSRNWLIADGTRLSNKRRFRH